MIDRPGVDGPNVSGAARAPRLQPEPAGETGTAGVTGEKELGGIERKEDERKTKTRLGDESEKTGGELTEDLAGFEGRV